MPRGEFTIRGETAVVTGAAGGIGRTIATRLPAVGANVVANDVADAVLLLCSNLSDRIAGQNVNVSAARAME